MHARSLADSIERYAELCAQLDAAFPDRAEILRAANLDEGGLLYLQAHWTSQLIRSSGADIAARFGAAYSAARRSVSERGAAENRTSEIRCLRVGPALPFQPPRPVEESGVRPAPAPCRIHEPPIRPAPGAVMAAEGTMEIPVFARRPAVLPFVAAHVPCRRLHRFDSQTGLPLPTPYWSDDASDPTKPG